MIQVDTPYNSFGSPLTHFVSVLVRTNPNFLFTTKMVYPKSSKSIRSRSASSQSEQLPSPHTNNTPNYFASSNPRPPHSRACDREHTCVNSSMVFKWLGAYDCSTSFALRALSTCLCYPPVCVSNSTCLRANLENSNIGSVNKSQAPCKKKPDGGQNKVACSQPKATQKPGGTEAKPDWRDPARYCPGTWQDPPARDTHGTLGRIHWRATLGYSAGYSAGSTAGLLWWDTRRDPLANYSAGSTLGYSAGYSAGSTGGLLWWDALRALAS